MGRKLKPLNQRSTNIFNFRAPLDDPLFYGVMEKAYTIIRRESYTFDEFCTRAVEEYVGRHFDGNYQTLLASYKPGGVKSEGQQEQELYKYYLDRAEKGMDIRLTEIKTRLRETLGYEGGKVQQTAERIAQRLHEEDVKVWW